MMNKILGSLLFFGLTFLSAGTLTATVDRSEVVKGDTVLLTLSVTGEKIDEIPEIEEISGQKVLNIQRHTDSNFVHLNGISSMVKTETLTLEFRPNASMTIPAFSVNVDGKTVTAKEIKITVLKPTLGTKRATKNFALEMTLNKPKLYVGESAILTVYFKQRTKVDVVQVEYTPPKLKEFFFKQLGEGKTYKEGIFTIQELNYLVTPKVEGRLTLDPARAKVAQRSREKQEGGWYADVPKWHQLSSPTLTLNVVAPLEEHDVMGIYRLKEEIDQTHVKANQPVGLTIALTGEGVLDDYEGINFNIPNVTLYADDANHTNRVVGKVLQSHYEQHFVFISEHSFTIPSKTIRVYNPQSNEVTLLKTKTYQIEIEGSPSSLKSDVDSTENVAPLVSQDKNVSKALTGTLPSFLALLFAFALGATITMALKYLPSFSFSRGKKKPFKANEALRILYPKMSENREVEAMVRKLYALQKGEKNIKIDKQRLKELVEYYK